MRNREDKKSKKGQESTIGKIIYGFLLFMPLLAIISTCLITTFNMSAKQESEITYKYETNEVNDITDLKVGNIYKYENYLTNSNFILYADSFYVVDRPPNVIKLDVFSDYSLYLSGDRIISETYGVSITDNTNFYFVYSSYLGNLQNYISNISISDYNEIESVETHNINAEDVFYYSVDKVEQSNLFNWAQNSIIYTTTHNTCNALNISNTFIPLLLSYWLIISVLYFLYDIALMLVWIVHRKIHEMQESI